MDIQQVPFWWLIISSVAGLLLGSGALWRWSTAQIERARLEIDKAKASTELRAKMNELLIDIMKFQRDPTYRKQHYLEYKARIDDYNALERNLAKLEGRQAVVRDFERMLPNAPTNLRIE